MTASRTWTPATPATYDAGDGAMIHVSESGPYIRRQRRSYCGRGGDWTTYTHDPRDQGGPRPPVGVNTHTTMGAALDDAARKANAEGDAAREADDADLRWADRLAQQQAW